MNNKKMAEQIAALPRTLQIALMTQAARVTAKRSVRGQTSHRFYAHECGLSPRIIHRGGSTAGRRPFAAVFV